MFRAWLLLVVFSFHSFAQFGGRSANFEISARVVLENNAPMTSSPIVTLHVPGSLSDCLGKELFGNGTLRLLVPGVFIQGEPQIGCSISLMLTGYRPFVGFVHDGTTIMLHRIGPNEGSSVSIRSLNVPLAARKEYDAGEGAASKRKWPQAEQHFRNAVELSPDYATAWSELGQCLQDENRFDDAIAAFAKAREADPQYLKPIVQLASASSLQQQWAEEMKFSQEALRRHPVDFPAAYFYYAEATFHLGNLDEAERLTRDAIRLDPGVTCPETLVLLGEIFEKQGHSHNATVEYKSYLKQASHGIRAAEARNAIARLNSK